MICKNTFDPAPTCFNGAFSFRHMTLAEVASAALATATARASGADDQQTGEQTSAASLYERVFLQTLCTHIVCFQTLYSHTLCSQALVRLLCSSYVYVSADNEIGLLPTVPANGVAGGA